MGKEARRLRRQFDALGRAAPPSRRLVDYLLRDRFRLVRLPLALLLILGGLLSILPIFGLWMLPLGLMLLSVDIPLLRPGVSGALIRLRRRASLWGRRARGHRARDRLARASGALRAAFAQNRSGPPAP